MSDKKLLPADLDPRNPSYAYKNKYNEHVENTDQFNNYVKSTEVKKVFSGMLWGEGPAYIPHLDTLVWSDIPNNRMLKLSNGKVDVYKDPSNYTNGNTTDNAGNIISCSHGGRCIYKTNDNLEVQTLVDNFNGKKLNSPNDLFVKSDGSIWFTDPPYGILSDYEGYPGEQEYGGCYVFSYDPNSKKLNVLILKTN
jgi:gluconolactonase